MKRKITIVFALILIAIIASVVAVRDREPYYDGRPVGYWCARLLREGYSESFPDLDSRAAPYLLALLDKRNDAASRVRVLAFFGHAAQLHATNVIPDVIKCLSDPEPSVVAHASEVLASVGASAVPFILKSLANERERFGAMSALAQMGKVGQPATPKLLPFLGDKDAAIRRLAIYILGEIGPGAESAVPHLKPLLNHEQADTRLEAIIALWKITKDEADLVEPLVGIANQRDFTYRQRAYEVLSQMQPGTTHIPMLKAALRDSDATIRCYSAAALMRMSTTDSSPAIATLIDLVRNDGGVRLQAMELLATVRPRSKEIRDVLSEIAEREGDILSPIAERMIETVE